MARKGSSSEGSAERNIHVQERSKGYVVFTPGNLLDLGDQYPIHLSMTFDRWLKMNPGVSVREVLPVVDNGRTVILHVWYDGHLTSQQ